MTAVESSASVGKVASFSSLDQNEAGAVVY